MLTHSSSCLPVGTRRVKGSRLDQVIERSHSTSESIGEQTDSHCSGYADPDGTEEIEAWSCVESCPVRQLDEQSGERQAGARPKHKSAAARGWSGGHLDEVFAERIEFDSGGASRFFPVFRYQAKASARERNAGLEGFEERAPGFQANGQRSTRLGNQGERTAGERSVAISPRANVHPTVKPLELMRWLVRLVTPPMTPEGKPGTVLDCFTGSGSTGIAAIQEGFYFIGIEQDAEYVEIARARIAHWAAQVPQLELAA